MLTCFVLVASIWRNPQFQYSHIVIWILFFTQAFAVGIALGNGIRFDLITVLHVVIPAGLFVWPYLNPKAEFEVIVPIIAATVGLLTYLIPTGIGFLKDFA